MTRPKEIQKRYDKGHGDGHINKGIFPKLKQSLEASGYEVTITKENNNLVYFKFLAKQAETVKAADGE